MFAVRVIPGVIAPWAVPAGTPWMGSASRRAIFVAALFAALAASPDALAISRQQANAIAMRELRPQARQGPVVLFGLRTALRSKQSVVAATPRRLGLEPRKKGLRPLGRKTWLFWLDLAYEAKFAHPSMMLLVDDATGRVTARRSLRYYPLVDGRLPTFLRTPAAYRSARYQIFPARRNAVFTRRPAASPLSVVQLALPADAFKDDCMIMIGSWNDAKMEKDFEDMAAFAQTVGLRAFWTSSSGQPSRTRPSDGTPPGHALPRNVAWLVENEGCKDVFVYVSSHGSPLALHVKEGAPLEIQHFDDMLRSNPDVTFKIKIDACHSGSFLTPGLTGHKNLLLLETSSLGTERSYSFRSFPRLPDGKVIEREVPNPGRGEFTHGNLVGMRKFVTSNAEVTLAQRAGGSLLARMLSRAFALGEGSDAARLLRDTHPQLHTNFVGNTPPTVGPIKATFAVPVTTYGVTASDPDGGALRFTWTKTGSDCGTFRANFPSANEAEWSHPHPPCPAETFHPATITVVVSDGVFDCTVTYPDGSAAGTGPPPGPCVRRP